MEDFRSKIKNHKATPTESSWAGFETKKASAGIVKVKYFLYGFIGLNAIVLGLLAYQWLNLSKGNSQQPDVEVPTLIGLQERAGGQENREQLAELSQLRLQNSELSDEVSLLQSQLLSLNNTLSDRPVIFKNRPATPIFPTAQQTAKLYAEWEKQYQQQNLNQEIQKTEPVAITSLAQQSLSTLTTVPGIRSRFSIEQYIHGLLNADRVPANNNIPTITTPIKNDEHKWYMTIGSSRENLVTDRQRNMHFGIARQITKRFDVGLLFDFNNDTQRGEFLVANDIRDFRTDIYGLGYLRYHFIQRSRLQLYVDAGAGYEYGIINYRQSRVVDNTLDYFNESITFQGLTAQIGLGARYRFTPRFSLGTRFHLRANLHTAFNLNYHF